MLLTKRVMEAFLDIGLKFARQDSIFEWGTAVRRNIHIKNIL